MRTHVTNAFDFDIRIELDRLDALCEAGNASDALRGYEALISKYGTQRWVDAIPNGNAQKLLAAWYSTELPKIDSRKFC